MLKGGAFNTGGSTIRSGIPTMLGRSAIPFVSLSSGSVSAAGAISAITALPLAYANAYCFFPANALATAIAAGWYYCTFSTTTAGTAFLNTYTSGIPMIPASPTAVIDGKGAFTGDTGEEFGPTIAVPANAMGPNGCMDVVVQYTASPNNANNKTSRVRYSGNAGVVAHTLSLASQMIEQAFVRIQNRGVANIQVLPLGGYSGFGASGGGGTALSNIDTTAATTIVISLQKATATDNHVVENYSVLLMADGT